MQPQAVFLRAHQAYGARRYEAAVADLSRLVARGVRQPQVLHLLALAHKGRGDMPAARRAFAEALAAAPRDPEILNNHGNLLSDLGEHDAALASYDAALAARPGFCNAGLNRALALNALGRFDEALPELDRLARERPGSAAVHAARGHGLRGSRRLAEAEEAYDAALALDPARPAALHGKARCALERGKPAADLYRRALAARPGDADIAMGLAEALEAAGEPGADDVLARAVAERPDWVAGQTTLARMRWEAGEGEAFARDLEAACAAGGTPELWRALVATLAHADLFARAADAAAEARKALGGEEWLLAEAVAASDGGDTARAEPLFAALSAEAGGLARARHEIRTGRLDAALARVDRAREADGESIEAWAMTGLLWRALGDPRAAWLHEQDGLVRLVELDLDAPALDRVAAALRALHRTRVHPIGQSLRGGTQTRGDLFASADPVIVAFRDAIARAVDGYWRALPPEDPAHPLLRHRGRTPVFAGSWSVRLTGGGFHVSHFHSHGLLSSACYLVVPPAAGPMDGWLEIGRPPANLRLDLPPLATLEPRPGRLALFPSTLFHGTRPFGAGERLTAAFDVTVAR